MNAKQEQMVLDHLYLIKIFLHAQIDIRALPPSIDESDLYQQGALVLMRAAELFKNTGKAKFATYANKSIRLALIGYIGNQRWGPKESKRYKMKRAGQERVEDMVSYDGLPTDADGRHFLETVPSIDVDLDGAALSRITPEMASTILSSILAAAQRRTPKNVSALGQGVSWAAKDKKYRATAIVCGKHFHIGLFDSPEEAGAERMAFLKNLEAFCLERIEVTTGGNAITTDRTI